jgi:hypothetical protein
MLLYWCVVVLIDCCEQLCAAVLRCAALCGCAVFTMVERGSNGKSEVT